MKKIIALLLPLLILCSLTACGSSRKIRFGTAGIGGNYYLFGQTLTEYVSQDTDLVFEVKETAGSAANLRLLQENYISVAIAQTDMIDEAVKSGNSDFSALSALYTEYCQIVVRDDSEIKTVSDLRGKTVSVGEEESGTAQNASQILSAYGISDNLLKTRNMNYTKAAEALKNGEIDAMFVTAGIQTSVIESLAKELPIRFLQVEGNALSILTDSYDFYYAAVIPAGTYTGQDADVATIGVKSVLLVGNKISENAAYTLTKELYEHASDLQYAMPLSLELSLDGITVPLHPGAKKYYQEAGIEIPSGM